MRLVLLHRLSVWYCADSLEETLDLRVEVPGDDESRLTRVRSKEGRHELGQVHSISGCRKALSVRGFNPLEPTRLKSQEPHWSWRVRVRFEDENPGVRRCA